VSARAPDPSAAIHALLPALAVLAILSLAGGVAFGPRYSAAAAFTLGTSLVIVVVFHLMRRSLPRAGALAAAHALTWAGIVFHATMNELHVSLVRLPHGVSAPSTFAGEGPAVWALLAGTAVVLHAVAASRPAMRRFLDASLRGLALGATLLLASAAALAVARAGRPDPDVLVATFPIEGQLKPGEHGTFAGKEISMDRSHWVGEGAATVPEGESPPPPPCAIRGIPYEDDAHRTEDCSDAIFRLDPQGTYVVVERGSGAKDAFLLRSWRRVALRPSQVAPRLSPPIGWTVAGVITAPLAVLFLALGARARRSAKRALQCGALAAPSPSDGPYRRLAVPMDAEADGAEELRVRLLGIAVSYDGLAAAVACLGLAPLAACRVIGLL